MRVMNPNHWMLQRSVCRLFSLWYEVGEGFVSCIVGVLWDVWPHAMSVIVVERVKRVGAVRRTLNGYPKGLLVKLL